MANTKDEKKKRKNHTTPKGEALFIHLVTPDHGTTEFPDEDGSFTITLRLSEDEADRLKAMISDELEEAKAEMQEKFDAMPVATRKKLKEPTWIEPGAVEYDRETEEPTGNILFRFKTKAIYKDKKTGQIRKRKVPVFDSMQTPVKLATEPGFGSLVRVSFSAQPYFVGGTGNAGVAFYLNAVQILKLNAAGERSAADYGFAAEEDEGGFMASSLDEDQSFSRRGDDDDLGPAFPSEATNPDDVPF